MKISIIKKFVKPYYDKKDIMHNLFHVERVYKIAKTLSKKYKVDGDLLAFGAYFHGVIRLYPNEIERFLKSQQIPSEKIKKIMQAAEETQKNVKRETLEGKILHDAHLLEGGKTFLITKSLVTGTVRGQTLEQTIKFINEKIISSIGKVKCYLPDAQKQYKEKEQFAKEFINNLKQNL